VVASARAQQTKPERTGYLETSSHADVIAFLNDLKARAGNRIHVGSLGRTTQGRDLPYVIASRPLVTTPAQARQLRRPIVFVQGNIHGGEVEGKEALQALLRDLVMATGPSVLDSIVLMAVPDYNADGNDDFGPQRQRRGSQQGPELVGTRANSQGLNLNRDYIKADAPETRGSLSAFNAWDPHIFVDLHTSNGSAHGYALTYSPSLHPAGDLANATFGASYARDSMLPVIRTRMRERHQFEIFDYGNFAGGGGGRGGRGGGLTDTMPQAWRTYEHVPRFGTNYYALRGRIAILSEAYSHDPFERRVKSTYAFTREILSFAAERSASILALAERSDRNLAAGRLTDVPVRARMTTTPIRVPVLHEIVEATGDTLVTEVGFPRGFRRTGRIKSTVMNVHDRFEATRTVNAPAAYLLPPGADSIVKMLRLHGVTVEQLRAAWSGSAEAFTVDSLIRERPFEGHPLTRLEGRWRTFTATAAEGSYLVRTTQPLGVLAVILLEPECDDGLATWGSVDSFLAVGRDYPVLRARAPVTVPARIVP
jgi:hypothetical protein